MSRIEKTFIELQQSKKTALIPYITAGDPHPDITVSLMHTMVEAGADLIELGVPFSDPMADGPVIQQACERALAHNVSLANVLNMVTEFRQNNQQTPIVLMGYTNPIEVMGYDIFTQRARDAGVDGVLTVDLPPEEAADVNALFQEHDLDSIFLLSPTSTEQRIQSICAMASGFVYYVSLKGVTGAANLDTNAVKEKIAEIKKFTTLPIGVGFGIKDAETAAKVAQIADAVVVGSAIIKKIIDNINDQKQMTAEVHQLLAGMRAAIDA